MTFYILDGSKMLEQLIPVFALAGVFGIYTLWHIVRHLWLMALYEPRELYRDNKEIK